MEPQPPAGKKRDYLLPASILIAALLVSISLVYNAGKQATPTQTGDLAAAANANQPTAQPAGGSASSMKPVSADDHILGDPNAPVKMVEFSDLECPFCKEFQATLHQVLQAYPGKVAWIFRQSPIPQLHPKAEKEAEASECAWEQGGNDIFWKYIDQIFSITPSNNGLDPAQLPKVAGDLGLDVTKFNACLSSGKYASKIAAEQADAAAAGSQGTPYTVIIGKSGQRFVVPGAYPFDSSQAGAPSVKSFIDQALQ